MKNTRQRILIIEDSQDTRTLLEMALSRKGYQVFMAPNGKSALRQMSIVQPDLILLDLMMAEMDGWEVLKQVRVNSRVPVIVLSAQNNQTEKAKLYGANDYLVKPINLNSLQNRIQHLLQVPNNGAKPQRPVYSTKG